MKNCFFSRKGATIFHVKKEPQWNSQIVLRSFNFTRHLQKAPMGSCALCCFCFLVDVWSLSVGQENKNRGFLAGEGGSIFEKSGHLQNSLRYIRGRQGLFPAGGGVRVFSRGENLAMGGVWILAGAFKPVWGGAQIFSRGGGPAGGGNEKIYPRQGPAVGGVRVISRGLLLAGAYPGPRNSLNLCRLQ